MATQDSRILIKRSTTTNVVPTVPASNDHTDGTWLATDIYKGELFYNQADNHLWSRDDDGVQSILFTKRITISAAEMLAIYTTPKACGLTVPAGYFPHASNVSASLTFGTTPFATNTQLQITNGGTAALGTIGNNLLASTASKICTAYSPANPTAGQTQATAATDLYITNTTGNPTAGDSDTVVYITGRFIKI